MPEPKETIGQRLKRIRTSRQISLDKAAEATRVRAHYLQALEADNYSVMSSAAQSRGFLRIYADYLGLDLDAAMQELSEGDSADAPPAAPAPVDETPPPAPLVPQETPPASPADEKPVRRPFWARLLRRSVPEEPAAESESAPEPAAVQESAPEPAAVQEPAPEPGADEAPVVIPETESAPTPVRKTDASSPKKKSASAAKASRPKTTKPKAAAKSAAKSGKKKASPKARQSKRRR